MTNKRRGPVIKRFRAWLARKIQPYPTHSFPGHEDRLAHVIYWIRARPGRVHYVATRYTATEAILRAALPDANMIIKTTMRMATGWSTDDPDACLSCTYLIPSKAMAGQLCGRLRNSRPEYYVRTRADVDT